VDFANIFGDAFRTALGPVAAAYAVAGIGLNLQFGFTGLLNFGHVAFLLAGAYGMAITVDQGGPLWLGVIAGIAAAVVLGLVFGLPTLRLRSHYLAIVTIAVGEVLRIIVRSPGEESITGGVFGLQRFANGFFEANPFEGGRVGWGSFSYTTRSLWVMVLAWPTVFICAYLVRYLTRSPWGRVLRAIREDEDAARSLGKNVFAFKLQSLIIGGAIGALAGMLLAIDRQDVRPDTFLPVVTFAIYTIVILGGTGSSPLGPILGAVIYWFVIQFTDSFLREGIGSNVIPSSVISINDIAAIRFGLVGVALMLLMVFRPQGILGKREEVILESQ
jgi:branched-chain amino acid transport system permease protein